jgi:DivIVA domain-containing protein
MAQQTNDSSGTAAHTDRIPVSAEQIRTRRFRPSPLGRRGYRPEEVDGFLDRVADEIEHLSAANADAHAEIDRLRNWFRNHSDHPANTRADIDTDGIPNLANPLRFADEVVSQIQRNARGRYADVRSNAGAIVVQARQAAEHAARDYRAQAGSDYSHDREQAERTATFARSLLALLSGATMYLDGAAVQVHTMWHALDGELSRLIGDPDGKPAIGRASPTDLAPEWD